MKMCRCAACADPFNYNRSVVELAIGGVVGGTSGAWCKHMSLGQIVTMARQSLRLLLFDLVVGGGSGVKSCSWTNPISVFGAGIPSSTAVPSAGMKILGDRWSKFAKYSCYSKFTPDSFAVTDNCCCSIGGVVRSLFTNYPSSSTFNCQLLFDYCCFMFHQQGRLII